MSFINAFTKCIFGRTINNDPPARSMSGANAQRVRELVAGTESRVTKGPQLNGHFSFHVSIAAGVAPAGTLTVWYSNLPNPDPTLDGDWVLDPAIPAINLAVVANTFVNVGNVNSEHIRFKITQQAGAIAELYLWARTEGVENR